MRKYQQLLLLTLSLTSVIILLVYKTENRRLRQVLNVVNFFGRNATNADESRHTVKDEFLSYASPLPVWQLIGSGFHVYSAYWRPVNATDNADRAEAIAIVVAGGATVVDFHCSLYYKSNTHHVKGQFRFQRSYRTDGNAAFTYYNFFCTALSALDYPHHVTFTHIASRPNLVARSIPIKLRLIPEINTTNVTPLTICLDLSQTYEQDAHSVKFASHKNYMQQFFFHHYLQNVNDFLVYKGDEVTEETIDKLHQYSLQLHLLPFNFPFAADDSGAVAGIRQIILTDCMIRSFGRAQYVLLLSPNEFLFANGKLQKMGGDLLDHLSRHVDPTMRFQLSTLHVCMAPDQRLLINNTHYSAEGGGSDVFINRPRSLHSAAKTPHDNHIAVPKSVAVIHRYASCSPSADSLHDWQVSLRLDFMRHVQRLRKEIQLLV